MGLCVCLCVCPLFVVCLSGWPKMSWNLKLSEVWCRSNFVRLAVACRWENISCGWMKKYFRDGGWYDIWILDFIFHISSLDNDFWKCRVGGVWVWCDVTGWEGRAVLIISLFFFNHCINMPDRGYPILWGRVVPKGGTLDLFFGANWIRNSMVLFPNPESAWNSPNF